jgi:Ca-activated chloride channel family protein
MSDEHKMEYAKSALSKLIDQLNNEDIFSLVVYDDVIDVLRSAQRVGSNKSEVKRLVNDIYPRNSTNLGGGMIEGLRQVERNVGKDYVNRVVLLSDGLANQGVTSPHELNKIAKRYRHKSISLTTMGVGLDYNENLMVGLAESGGGNYYFIESPSQLASIMHREFNTLSSVVAQNAMLDLKLGQGVKLLDVIGCEHSPASDRHTIYIGDLYANEIREFTVELSIPEAISAGRLVTSTRVVAIGSLNYRSDNGRLHSTPTFTATVTYTRELAAIDKHRDLDVQAKADIAVSTRSVDQAMKALDDGRAEEAKRELSSARMMLMSSPAAAAQGAGASAIQEQASRLDSFNETLNSKDSDARKAKKSIQYENYRVQKNK